MQFLVFALQILTYVVIGDAILSWIQSPDKFPRKLTAQITDPLYKPIRAILDPQKTGGIDFSPLIVIVAIQAIQRMLMNLQL